MNDHRPLNIALISARPLGHYRSAAIRSLRVDQGIRVDYYVDSESRGDITPISLDEFDEVFQRRVIRVGPMGWLRGTVALIRRRRRYDAFVLNGDPAILSTWVLLAALRLLGHPTAIWTIGWMQPANGRRDRIKRLLYRHATALLLYGDFGREQALSEGFDARRLHVVYNSAISAAALTHPAQQRRDPVARRTEIGLDPGCPTVIHVGRLRPDKNLGDLYAAAETCAVAFQAIIVGGGEFRRELERMAEESEVATHFAGEVTDSDRLARLYEAADIAVVPGNFGLAAVQPLYFGVPVVATLEPPLRYPEAESLVAGVTGVQYRRGDVSALARCLEQAFRMAAESGEEIAEAAYLRVTDRYTGEAQAGRIASALHSIARPVDHD